jgi:small conductance mechanosensitive channel
MTHVVLADLRAGPLTDACGRPGTRRWLCDAVFELTDSHYAARLGHQLSPWVTTLLILVGAFVVNRIVRRLIKRVGRRLAQPATGQRLQTLRRRTGFETSTGTPALRREQRAQSISDGLRSFASLIIGLITLFAILGAWGIELGSILAGAGLLGVVIGFGAQNLLRDIISGTFMLLEDQFGIGDVIDVGDAIGTVEHMSLRTTRLRDVEGVVWHVPNGEVKRVGNRSQGLVSGQPEKPGPSPGTTRR